MSDSCDPMDCSLPGSSVHGILQARILEWVAISFSRGSSWPRNRTPVSCIAGRFGLSFSKALKWLKSPCFSQKLGIFSVDLGTALFAPYLLLSCPPFPPMYLPGHGTTDWFQIGKEVCQGYMLSPCLFNLHAEYLMRNAGLDEAQAGIKIAGRNNQ